MRGTAGFSCGASLRLRGLQAVILGLATVPGLLALSIWRDPLLILPVLAALWLHRQLGELDPRHLRLRVFEGGWAVWDRGSGHWRPCSLTAHGRFQDLLWLGVHGADVDPRRYLVFSDCLGERRWRLLRCRLRGPAPGPGRAHSIRG